MSVWSPRPSVWKPGQAPTTPISPIPVKPGPKPKPRREASEEEERPRIYYPGIPLAMYPRRRHRAYYHGIPLTMWPRKEVYIPGIKLAVYPEKQEEIVEIPVRSERGIPVSDQAVIEKGLGQIRGYEKILFTPSRLGIQYSSQLSQEALEHKARGEHHIGIAKSIGASGIAFLSGVYEGMAAFLAPWVIAEGIAALATRPREVAESYIENPLNISRTVGAVVGGYLVGKLVGKAIGKLRSRRAMPREYELTASRFKTVRARGSIESIGPYKYRLVSTEYIERGIARPVYSLGRPEGLVGEYSIVLTKKGGWRSIRLEGWRLRGSRLMLEKPVKVYKAVEPSGKGEFTVGKTFEAYGVGGKAPYLFSKEIVAYGSKPVWFSESVLKDISVTVKKPGPLSRLFNWLRRRPSTEKITYTARGASRYGMFLGYRLEAGGVAPSTILEIPRPSPVIRLTPRIIYDLGPEFSTASLFASLPRQYSRRKIYESITVKPVVFERIRRFIGLKTPSRTVSLPREIIYEYYKYAPRQAPLTSTGTTEKLLSMPRLIVSTETMVKTTKPPVLPTVKTRKKRSRRKQRVKPRKKRSKKLVYYEVLYPEIPLPKL